jgi:hypothetical protein
MNLALTPGCTTNITTLNTLNDLTLKVKFAEHLLQPKVLSVSQSVVMLVLLS